MHQFLDKAYLVHRYPAHGVYAFPTELERQQRIDLGLGSCAGVRLYVALMLLLSMNIACVNRSQVPTDHYYRLPEVAASHVTIQAPVERLGVARLVADGLHSERAILYIDRTQPLEVRRYHYHHWVQAPPDLIRDYLVDYLRAIRMARTVVRYRAGATVDGVIFGRLIRFERIVDGNDYRVDVAIELGVKRGNTNPHGWEKQYSAIVNSKGSSMHDTVQAFGDALNKIYHDFVADLEKRHTNV